MILAPLIVVRVRHCFNLVFNFLFSAHDHEAQAPGDGDAQGVQMAKDAGAIRDNQITHENVGHRDCKAKASFEGHLEGNGHEKKGPIADIARDAALKATAETTVAPAGEDCADNGFGCQRANQKIEQKQVDTEHSAGRAYTGSEKKLSREPLLKIGEIAVQGSDPVDVIHV